MHLTLQQRHAARALMRECHDLERALEQRRIRLRLAQEANLVQQNARNDRVDFYHDEQKLAGIAELYKRTDESTRGIINFDYKRLLRNMHDPIRQLEGAAFPPIRVDFHKLNAQARCYLLGPFLNLSIGGAFVALDIALSDPSGGRLLYVSHHGPIDADAIKAKMPIVNGWLPDHWELASHTVNTFILVHRAKLPARIPFEPSHHLKRGALFAGINTTSREPLHIPFSALTSGTLVAGVAGAGKTNALHVLIQSFLANTDTFSHILLIDGKWGVGFNRYRNIHPKVTVLWDETDFWAITPQLVAEMRTRNIRQRNANIDNATGSFVAVIVDEMSTYTARPSSDPKSPTNKQHTQFIDELTTLARRGRSTGFRFFYTVQEPTDAQIPTAIRNNCQTVLSFRLGIDQHATSLFGQLDGLPADPRKLKLGFALFRDGQTGAMHHVKFPVME